MLTLWLGSMSNFSSAPILAVAVSPDGQTAVAASGDRKLGVARLCRPGSSCDSFLNLSCESAKFVGTKSVSSLCYPSEGTLYAANTAGSFVRYRLAETGQPLVDYEVSDAHGSGGELTGIAAVSNSSIVVSSGKDATVRCWDPETRQSVARLTGHKYEVRGVAAAESESASGASGVVNIIASAGRDKTVRLWDVRASESSPVFVFSGHTGWVHDVAISGGGGRSVIVSCAGDKTVRVWDLGMMRQVKVFTGHEYRVWGVGVSSDGGFAISGSTDTTVRAWDLAEQPKAESECITFEGHRDSVISVAVCRDGTAAVSGCEDGSLFVWNTSGIFGRSTASKELCALEASPILEPVTVTPALDPTTNEPGAAAFQCDSTSPNSITTSQSLRPGHDITGFAISTGGASTALNKQSSSHLESKVESQMTAVFTEESTGTEIPEATPADGFSSDLLASEGHAAESSAAIIREPSCAPTSAGQMTAETSSRIELLESELRAAKRLAISANARVGPEPSFANKFEEAERQPGSATGPEADRRCPLPITDRLQDVLLKLDAMLAS